MAQWPTGSVSGNAGSVRLNAPTCAASAARSACQMILSITMIPSMFVIRAVDATVGPVT
jgi:hypothetical protein